ncbi:MAG: hypothetical protein EOP73_13440 [Variovorax sp.]|nr:MAG: hypothetical protein EOP73_13440 [Variovorax sp.]
MNDATGAVLALWNDVAPEMRDDYEDWHANEHVPERLTVPGMLWGRRYLRTGTDPGEGEGTVPRYLTLYGMRDAAVLESEPYRLLLARPTPASARMRPHLRDLSRWVCEVVERRGAFGAMAAGGLAVWTSNTEDAVRAFAREHVPDGTGDLLLCRRCPDAAPLPWLAGTQAAAAAVDGSWLLAVGLPAMPDAARQRDAMAGATLYRGLAVAAVRP